jgi:membrane protein implicated in regulation of membrane protease activity
LWLSAIIPVLWLLISGLTLLVLDATAAIVLFAVLAIGLIGLVWKSVEYRSA